MVCSPTLTRLAPLVPRGRLTEPTPATLTPALLGGADDQMLSYYIAQYTNVEVNWGMACALGAVLLAATLILYGVYRRVVKSELSLG